MAIVHIWVKCNILTTYEEADWGTCEVSGYIRTPVVPSGSTGYDFDSTKGYVLRNTTGTASTTGSVVYTGGGKSITKYTTTSTDEVNTNGSVHMVYTGRIETNGVIENETVGTTVGSVKSTTRSAYPDNDKKDGYWYIYIGSETVPDIKAYVNINGVAKDVSAIYVNVDGEAKPATNLYCNIDGTDKNYKVVI